ncbi:anthrone oxygenase family protein [Streptomyces sp. NPDC004362]|uniref:anthrone oxygenase family protein n=1 Tax=Streptomyces sp. NPDC004362 TaxID=3154456 RepID=UPI0033A44139
MTDAAFVKTVRYTSLLCCAILSGVAVTVLFLELALRQLTGPAYIRVRQVEFGFFTWYIGAVTVPTLVAVVMLVLHARRAHSAVLRPSVVALVLLLLALLVTLVVNGPVNVEESGWNALTPPADWARVRDRWQIDHAVRTVAIVLALGFLGVAVPDRPAPVSSGHGGAET